MPPARVSGSAKCLLLARRRPRAGRAGRPGRECQGIGRVVDVRGCAPAPNTRPSREQEETVGAPSGTAPHLGLRTLQIDPKDVYRETRPRKTASANRHRDRTGVIELLLNCCPVGRRASSQQADMVQRGRSRHASRDLAATGIYQRETSLETRQAGQVKEARTGGF
jgi:hypothetical protein